MNATAKILTMAAAGVTAAAMACSGGERVYDEEPLSKHRAALSVDAGADAGDAGADTHHVQRRGRRR